MRFLICRIILPIFFGLLIAVVGIYLIVSESNVKSRNTLAVEATVVNYKKNETGSGDSSNSYSYSPVLSYIIDKKKYTSTSSVGYGEKKYEIGETVDIMVDPDVPENFHIKDGNGKLIVGIVMIPISLCLIASGVFTIIRIIKDPPDWDDEDEETEPQE